MTIYKLIGRAERKIQQSRRYKELVRGMNRKGNNTVYREK